MDTALPRDVMVVTPHFNVSGSAPTAPDLATALAIGVETWLNAFPPITVKVYLEDFGPPPHFPLGTATRNAAGTPLPSTMPREVALCLSYYQTHNVPRFRGRLYLPFAWLAKAANVTTGGQRPTGAIMNAALAFGTTVLKGQSGSGAQWGFASTVEKVFKAVTNYYVDDEWDTIRKRGLKPTTRVTGTVP